MKLLSSILVLWTLVAAISSANIEKRGAAFGIGGNVAVTTPQARPTIPSWINTLTSNLFNQNETTGMSPIYGFLKQLTSNIFPFISNTTYGFFKSFNPLLNGVSFNLYNGLCAPPSPKTPVAGQTAAPGMPTTTTTSAPASSNPITNIINLLLGNGGTTGTGATDPLSQLLAALGGTASNQATSTSNLLSTILGALENHFGNDASSLQSLLNALGGIVTGATGNTGTNLPSLFPGVTVTGGINLTLNVSPQLLNQYLSSIGQTVQSLQAALNSLGMNAQQFVQGLSLYGGNALAYLQSIFAKLANSLTPFPGVTVTGNVNTTLNLSPQAFNQLLASFGQTVQSLQAALNSLGTSAQQFVNGLFAYGGNALAYLQSIFAKLANPLATGTGSTGVLGGPFPGITVTGNVNTTLNLSPQAFSQLLASIGETVQTLQAALSTLSGTAQQFVDGLCDYEGNALTYLQAIFNQACQNTGTGSTNTLQGLLNNVLNG